MSYDIPTTEPARITAGDTIKWTKYLGDYDPGTWTLSYAFVRSVSGSGDQLIITAANNGDGSHLATISADDSASMSVGEYAWHAYVTSGTERHRVGEGTVRVLPNFAATGYSTTGYDGRTHAQKVLDAIEAVIEGRASSDQSSVSISTGGVSRSLSRMSHDELVAMRNHYRAERAREVRREQARRGAQTSKTRCRF